MAKRNGAYSLHDFYCMNCGNKGIGLMRKVSHNREKMHRKKLYCIYCREEVNHIECKNEIEVEEFKNNFIKGEYKIESEESISFIRSTRLGQINTGSVSAYT